VANGELYGSGTALRASCFHFTARLPSANATTARYGSSRVALAPQAEKEAISPPGNATGDDPVASNPRGE